MNWKQRIYCGDVAQKDSGRDVLMLGWVDAIRDHGNVLFIHLRDIRGIIQVVFSSEKNRECYDIAASLREEYVVEVKGKVALREKGTENPNIRTGNIEVDAFEIRILSCSKTLPFRISEKAMVLGEDISGGPENVDEDLRLQYRYLDLRRPSMQHLFIKRYEILKCIRTFLDKNNFYEIETPFLTRSTPEGARDYLVPSRVHHGKFYALPQSPQLFKQLLMMSGMDRYFQIARCFRDEDLRPNRQPEFTQLDMEASFIDEEFIYELIEELTVKIFSIGGIELPRPFPRMLYKTAIDKYGIDRPDLRFDMTFEDVTDILVNTQYSIFKQIIKNKGVIKGFCVKGMAEALSKNVLQNEYSMKIVQSFGAKGMTWMKVVDGRLQSNIVQFFSEAEQDALIKRFKAGDGDVLMMIADTDKAFVNRILCDLRLHVANRYNLIPKDKFCPVWVTDFPLFELKDGAPSSQHHPFTMPDRIDFDPENIDELMSLNSRAYDLVMNGEELGGGSIRIHDMNIQKKIFTALGLSQAEAEAKFGFFLRALEYGAPPHGGLALGIDRVISMILNTSSIRDVIAFPKNRKAFCPLTRAPNLADRSQLDELGLTGGVKVNRSAFDPDDSDEGKSKGKDAFKRDKISADEVRHVAKLARLSMTDEETDKYRNDLNSILDYVAALEDVDTKGITPMSHVLDIKNVWREDTPVERENPLELLNNAPDKEEAYYKVPKILEGN
ncbi:MAG: aspartate--tRNA ligase [Deltaproteobacteria bacterium]|nr:aspartate--tRNA ligase [Deltaproteobacteria bacterium]